MDRMIYWFDVKTGVPTNAELYRLELKVDHSPAEAIAQIKEKGYMMRFQGRLSDKTRYTGRLLLVGIGYDKKTKLHVCQIEVGIGYDTPDNHFALILRKYAGGCPAFLEKNRLK